MSRQWGLRIYVAMLGLAAGLTLWLPASDLWDDARPTLWSLLAFTLLFGLVESVDLNFHDEKGRIGLSTSEALLMPMIVTLPVGPLVWSVAIGMALGREAKRLFTLKGVFNVAQYTLSAGAAAGIWLLLGGATENGFTVRAAVTAALAILVFPILTQFFTSAVISLAEGGNFMDLFLRAMQPIFVSLQGTLLLGLLFSASFVSAPWTLVLFPFLITALFIGYRAMLRQQQERERVESLHSATRALAASPDLSQAVDGFLRAVMRIASAAEARLMLVSTDGADAGLRWWSIRHDEALSDPGQFNERKMVEMVHELHDSNQPLSITGYGSGSDSELADTLGVESLVAVPLEGGESVLGVLSVIDRVGTDEFDEADIRLLEALASELEVTLEAYGLFSQVAEERERFARIFNGSKEGICLLGIDGVVHAWNPALERFTGYAADSIMGKVWSDVVTIRDRSEIRLEADELVGVEPDDELELVTKNGPSRWITVIAGPVGDAEGGGWVILVRDVSAEHEIEAAKSDFLSTISHELRTPLTTIKGSLQVLARGRDNLPAALSDQMVGVTTRGAERLERLVMNLLVVSQIESGTMPVFPDAVAMEELVRERVDAMLSSHERKIINGFAQRLVVRADRERLNHAIEHILENAQKFGGTDGQITIDIGRDQGFARLSVSDEGPGIAPADQERIFERFTRLGDVLTRETQGAGVGLFIAARSVQAMGGEIWVESKLGEGSTFHITVPLAQPVAVVDDADTA